MQTLARTLRTLTVPTLRLAETKSFETQYHRQEYKQQTFVYTYGACMRFPYGQVAHMEMTEPDQQRYFDPAVDGVITVKEEALMGYCEDLANNDGHAPTTVCLLFC